MSTASPLPARDAALGGKYLTFFVGHEEYGVAISHVHEIVGLRAITRVPRTPVFVRGCMSLRGTEIPVVDLRQQFGLSPADVGACRDPREAARAEALRCVVVVTVAAGGAGRGTSARVPIGVVVDRVSEVAVIDADWVEDPPTFGMPVPTDFLLGVVPGGTRAQLLLDIDRVLAPHQGATPTRATF